MEWLQGGGTYGFICLVLLMPAEHSIVWVSNQCPTHRHVFPIFSLFMHFRPIFITKVQTNRERVFCLILIQKIQRTEAPLRSEVPGSLDQCNSNSELPSKSLQNHYAPY